MPNRVNPPSSRRKKIRMAAMGRTRACQRGTRRGDFDGESDSEGKSGRGLLLGAERECLVMIGLHSYVAQARFCPRQMGFWSGWRTISITDFVINFSVPGIRCCFFRNHVLLQLNAIRCFMFRGNHRTFIQKLKVQTTCQPWRTGRDPAQIMPAGEAKAENSRLT